ncbi:SRPBCC family protein [Leekyejoonella antrihumi]|nr:SRPBCC family protein [Leekyejoonella antrihumi]
MPTLRRVVTTTADSTTVMDYLVDFEHATQWDSGTTACIRISGHGGVDTVYRNTSTFAGRTVELDYTVESLTPERLVVVGRNKSTTSRDTITVTPLPDGASVEYVAEFTFNGLVALVVPLVKPMLERLGDRTAEQLRDCLDNLPAQGTRADRA